MSTKLVRYKDVCVALVPMIADMLQKGDVKPAIDTLKALGALEDVDPAKAVRECCKAKDHCAGCKYHRDSGRHNGCFFISADGAPEGWEI